MELLLAPPGQLLICWLEDQLEAISGTLDSLDLEGHQVEHLTKLDDARGFLAEHRVDLLLLDEHVAGDDYAGSKLVAELKSGALGELNIDVPFGFVTGARAWVNEAELRFFSEYLGLKVKGGELTRELQGWILPLIEGGRSDKDVKLRRVPICIEGVDSTQGAPSVLLSIPAWGLEPVRFEAEKLPDLMQEEMDRLTGRWFIARMNLFEEDPTRIIIEGWEPQDPLE